MKKMQQDMQKQNLDNIDKYEHIKREFPIGAQVKYKKDQSAGSYIRLRKQVCGKVENFITINNNLYVLVNEGRFQILVMPENLETISQCLSEKSS